MNALQLSADVRSQVFHFGDGRQERFLLGICEECAILRRLNFFDRWVAGLVGEDFLGEACVSSNHFGVQYVPIDLATYLDKINKMADLDTVNTMSFKTLTNTFYSAYKFQHFFPSPWLTCNWSSSSAITNSSSTSILLIWRYSDIPERPDYTTCLKFETPFINSQGPASTPGLHS